MLADVHANLAALEAVLAAVAAQAPDAIVCLGDLVGYNARPAGCIGRTRASGAATVAGNHDREACGVEAAAGRNALARAAMDWTRAVLPESERAWLEALPNRLVHPAGLVAVHGCYLNDTHYNGYVTSTMIEANLDVIGGRADWPTVGLCGHTHVPMCAWRARGEYHERDLREAASWPADADAVLVNPGAVGQPRDRDPRAAFAVVDLDRRRAAVHRIAYDLTAEQQAIRAAGLPLQLAERLAEGR